MPSGARAVPDEIRRRTLRRHALRRRGHWLERYLSDGNHRLGRLFRFALQDLIIDLAFWLGSVPAVGRLSRAWPAKLGALRWRRLVRGHDMRAIRQEHNGYLYRTPVDLAVSDTGIKRAILIGSCLAHRWLGFFHDMAPGCRFDFFISNYVGELPQTPPHPVEDYDFQLVQIPLRSIVPDGSFERIPHSDVAAHHQLFEEAQQRVKQFVAATLRWNTEHGLLTFVVNFLVPQQNPAGRLLPRYDLRNAVYFVEQLNICLSQELELYDNVQLVDIDQIASTFGRKFIQDDGVWRFNHASVLQDNFFHLDRRRIEPSLPVQDHYYVRDAEFIQAIWAELGAMYRTLRQVDQVKLVAVDLDDTLWRGIIAEDGQVDDAASEGWPRGLVEALCFLKNRGVMLAIVSRNEEARIVAIWDRIMGGRLRLEDFAARRINWSPKAENLEEIIGELGILPRSAVFIDDNPVERAAVKAALPEVRVLGAYPYYLRRVLLWSPESQVAFITQESVRRTEMVLAQAQREASRKRMSRREFLASLAIQVGMLEIRSADHPSFARAFELINKTNQFNTTGQRWTRTECAAAFSRGATFHAFEVEDRFTVYGLVGVAVTNAGCIEQFVMSCRVLGLDVEVAAVNEVALRLARDGVSRVTARLVETDANQPCRDLFEKCGFEKAAGEWVKLPDEATAAPRDAGWCHVSVKHAATH